MKCCSKKYLDMELLTKIDKKKKLEEMAKLKLPPSHDSVRVKI